MVVITEEMERPVDQQMRRMVLEGHAFFRRLDFADAMREYDFAYKRGLKLAEGSKIDAAVAQFEQSYTHWRKAMANNDYDLGARRHLRAS